ncbi:hypothetical protein COBT_000914 [Conglomerata obtusa]
MNPNELELTIIKFNQEELINFLINEKFLRNRNICTSCKTSKNIVTYKKCSAGKAWRCMNSLCKDYKKYESIRKDSFFEDFNLSITLIIRIILKYATRQTRFSIKEYFSIRTNNN